MSYILDKSQRSTFEEFRYSNYPEVALMAEKLDTLTLYLEKVQSAVGAYEGRETDKIYLNVAELKNMLNLCYEITDNLGLAPNPCFDLIMNLRQAQESLHELIYSHASEGNAVVSAEQPVEIIEDEGVIG